jgi:hypothetical protein
MCTRWENVAQESHPCHSDRSAAQWRNPSRPQLKTSCLMGQLLWISYEAALRFVRFAPFEMTLGSIGWRVAPVKLTTACKSAGD